VKSALNSEQPRPQQERRQFRRFPMLLSVQVRRDDLAALAAVPAQAAPDQAVTVEVRDFSLGGLGASSPTALRPGERLTVVMPPFGTRPQTELTGRVAHCDLRGDRFELGIEFCQTRDDPQSSPWLRIPELFYMSGDQSRQLQ